MKVFGYEPAVIVYAVNAGVAALVAWGLDLSADQTGAINTIVTAVLAAVVAAMTRPVTVSAITGAAATVATALAAFGLHLTADQIGASVTVGSIVLALLLRQNVTPAPAVTSGARPRA